MNCFIDLWTKSNDKAAILVLGLKNVAGISVICRTVAQLMSKILTKIVKSQNCYHKICDSNRVDVYYETDITYSFHINNLRVRIKQINLIVYKQMDQNCISISANKHPS